MRNLNSSKILFSIKLFLIASIMFATLFICQAQNVLAADTIPPVISGMPTNQVLEATSSAGASFAYAPTAFDAYDNASVTVTCIPVSGSTFSFSTTTVSCSAMDSSNNTATASFTVTVVDTTAPVISGGPSSSTIEATSSAGATFTYTTPTATDTVDGSVSVICSKASGSTFALGNTTVTCTATDSHANSAVPKIFVVTVSDTTAPAFLGVPSTITVEATSSAGAVATYVSPTANDIVSGAVLVNCSPVSGSTFPLGNTNVGCLATDGAGNIAGTSFIVSIVDTTAPVISGVPSTVVVEATSPAGAVATYTTPTALDIVDGVVPVGCTIASGTVFALGNHTVDCTTVDSSSNSDVVSFVVSIRDTIAPNITGTPSNIVSEATSPAGNVITYTLPTATDIVSGVVLVNCSPLSGSTFAIGNKAVVCSAKDSSKNFAVTSFVVSVRDTTAPVISSMPPNSTVEATSPAGAVATYTLPTVTDVVSTSLTANCTPVSGSTFALGSNAVTCTAKDFYNNTAVPKSFIINVVDTTAPVISGVPADFTVEATSASGAIATYTLPTANDIVSGAVSVNCSKASGTVFALGNTAVTCTAVDAASNFASVSFIVSIVDTTPPVISGLPVNNTREATSPAGATFTYTTPTALDIVDGIVSVNCSRASGTTFVIGNTTVTCTAKDVRNNSASSTFVVTIVDTTPPVISGVPSNITIEATSSAGADVTYTLPVANDIVSGIVFVNCSKASGSTFALGNTTVTCTAKDAKNNLASSAFMVSVVDTTPPIINTTLSTITVEATSPSGAVVTYATPTATDIVDGNVFVNCNYASNTTFALGSTMVSCIAVDIHGNGAWSAFIVTVRDTIAPVISNMPANITVGSSLPSGAIVTYIPPNATDIVSVNITVNCSKASGATFPVGNTLVNCTATDSSGNVASDVFLVTVTANPYYTSLGPIVVYDNVAINYAIGVADTGGNTVVGLTVSNPNFTINNATFVFTNATTPVAGTYPVVITAFNNLGMNASKSVLVTILTPQQQYVTSPTETVQANKTEMIVNQGSGGLNNIIVPPSITTSPIFVNFTALLSGTTVTMISDLSLTTTSTNSYTMFLPSGTIVTGDATWDGRLRLPVIQPAVYTIAGGNVILVIDVGGNSPLTFSQPVKIVLGGMSGRRAAWAYGTTALTDVPTVCDSATAPTNINAAGPKECYIDSGSDLLIWTYHSTAFAAYDVVVPTSTPSGGGGGGGGGSRYTCGNWTTCVDGKQTRNCTSGNRWQLEYSNCTVKIIPVVDVSKADTTANLTNATHKVTGADALKNARANTYSIKKITGNIADDLSSAISGMSNILVPLLVIAMLVSIGGLYLFYHFKNKRMDAELKKRK